MDYLISEYGFRIADFKKHLFVNIGMDSFLLLRTFLDRIYRVQRRLKITLYINYLKIKQAMNWRKE
jgi:hypothetical protein